VEERAGVDQRKRERKGPKRGEKGASRKEKQEEKEKLLRVLTQACTIQPLWMGRTHWCISGKDTLYSIHDTSMIRSVPTGIQLQTKQSVMIEAAL